MFPLAAPTEMAVQHIWLNKQFINKTHLMMRPSHTLHLIIFFSCETVNVQQMPLCLLLYRTFRYSSFGVSAVALAGWVYVNYTLQLLGFMAIELIQQKPPTRVHKTFPLLALHLAARHSPAQPSLHSPLSQIQTIFDHCYG